MRRGLLLSAAFLLLVLAAGDLLVIDCAVPGICAGTSGPAGCSDESRDDDCFCCCTHVVATPRVILRPLDRIRTAVVFAGISFMSADRARIDHPPRA